MILWQSGFTRHQKLDILTFFAFLGTTIGFKFFLFVPGLRRLSLIGRQILHLCPRSSEQLHLFFSLLGFDIDLCAVGNCHTIRFIYMFRNLCLIIFALVVLLLSVSIFIAFLYGYDFLVLSRH